MDLRTVNALAKDRDGLSMMKAYVRYRDEQRLRRAMGLTLALIVAVAFLTYPH